MAEPPPATNILCFLGSYPCVSVDPNLTDSILLACVGRKSTTKGPSERNQCDAKTREVTV